MKSVAQKSYRTPSKLAISDHFEKINYRQNQKDPNIQKLANNQDEQTKVQHTWNVMSGGSVTAESIEEFQEEAFYNEIGKIKLSDLSKGKSLLDLAGYAMYRKLQDDQDSQSQTKSDATEQGKKIKDELEELMELMNSGEFDENGDPYDDQDSDNDSDNDQDGDGDGNQKDTKKQSKSGKGSSETSVFERLRRIHDHTLSDLTWLIGREMKEFVPEVSINTDNPKEHPDGNERITRQIKDPSELYKVSPFDMALPEDLFNIKLAEESFMINSRAKGTLNKQFIYLLVDCSGSMSEWCSTPRYSKYKRIELAKSICEHFYERVLKDEAIVFFQGYRGDLLKRCEILSSKDAKTLREELDSQLRPGGGTFTDHALMTTQNFIRDWYKTVPDNFTIPEIVLITDGDDGVLPDRQDNDIRLNYIDVSGDINYSILDIADNTIRF